MPEFVSCLAMYFLRFLGGILVITLIGRCSADQSTNHLPIKTPFEFSSSLKDSFVNSGLDSAFIVRSVRSLDSAMAQRDLGTLANIDKLIYDSLVGLNNTNLAIAFLDNTLRFRESMVKDSGLYDDYSKALAFKAYEMQTSERFAEMKELLEELLELNRKWNSNKNAIYANLALGNVYTRYGDYDKAIKHLTICREDAAGNGDKANFNKACNNLAIAYKYEGKHELAIDNLKKVQNDAAPYSQTISSIELADNYMALLRYEDVENNIKAGLQHAAQLEEDDKNDLSAELYIIRGSLQALRGDNDQSLADFSHARDLKALSGMNPASREFGKLYLNIAAAYSAKSAFGNSLAYINKALATFCEIDSVNLLSLPARGELYAENTILEALDAKAGALQKLFDENKNIGYLQTAVDCYALSFEVERKLLQYFSYNNSKLLMLTESRHRSQTAIALCYQLYQTTKDNSWAEMAFQFAEKNKSFVLLESVKRNLASNNLLQNDTLYQRAQSLQLQLAYNERSFAESTSDSARRELSKQKTQLENDLLFANTALSRQSNAYKAVMQKEDSISTKMLTSDLLNEETGLIEFFSTDSITYAFVVDKDQPVKFIQYKASLSSQIDSLLNYFKNPTAISNDPMNYQRAAYNLYNELGLSLINKNWKQLIVIPDGKLSFVPFDALITSANFNTNLQQSPWLIQQCNAVYGYSALILLTQKNNNSNDATNISVFAPVFANNENGQKPLLFSQQEAEAVDRNNNNQVFTKKDASLANFRKQFEQPGILHIASHAYADTGTNNNPKIEFIDSSLLLNELYAMHTKASLVVLSACETGIGKVSSSEGPMSLARGFYYAGAKNVITSYWSVDDKSTAALFKDFYKILPGSTSSTALCEAKRSFIKNTSASYASPYYWAGFVHFGMPQEKEGGGYWWWLLAIPAVSLLIYWIKRMMQNKETEFYLKEKTGFEKRLDKK